MCAHSRACRSRLTIHLTSLQSRDEGVLNVVRDKALYPRKDGEEGVALDKSIRLITGVAQVTSGVLPEMSWFGGGCGGEVWHR